MNFIYSLVIAILLSIFFTQNIKKHKNIYYSISILISIVTIVYEILRITSNFKIYGLLYELERVSIKGILSISIFILVMFAGALNTNWKITRKLLSIRSELSIMASILMLPHGIIYVLRFILKILSASPLSVLYIFYIIIGIIGFIIMIPLFITSFNKIKRKMSGRKWKKVQKWAYIFYLLAYIHILIILLNGKQLDWLKLSAYTLIFGMYLILKLLKNYRKTI